MMCIYVPSILSPVTVDTGRAGPVGERDPDFMGDRECEEDKHIYTYIHTYTSALKPGATTVVARVRGSRSVARKGKEKERERERLTLCLTPLVDQRTRSEL